MTKEEPSFAGGDAEKVRTELPSVEEMDIDDIYVEITETGITLPEGWSKFSDGKMRDILLRVRSKEIRPGHKWGEGEDAALGGMG